MKPLRHTIVCSLTASLDLLVVLLLCDLDHDIEVLPASQTQQLHFSLLFVLLLLLLLSTVLFCIHRHLPGMDIHLNMHL